MNTDQPLSGSLARRPMLIMAAVMFLLVAVVAVLGWQFAFQGLRISVQDSTEASNRTLTRVFVNENWEAVKPLLPAPGSGAEAARSNPNIAAIDQIVRRFSSYTDVLKVKIYDLSGVTVYSSERKQIGEDKARNVGFLAAARGGVASELTHRGAFGAFDGERYDRNLVSTYVPVRLGDRVEAVLEIYSDRTASIEFVNRELRGLAMRMVPWLVLALLLVAAVGWRLYRSQLAAARDLAHARDQAGRLQAQAAAAAAGDAVALDRLPEVFEGLRLLVGPMREALASSGRPSSSRTPASADTVEVPTQGMEALLVSVESIGRWARLREDLAAARQGLPTPQIETCDLDQLVTAVVAETGQWADLAGRRISVYRHPQVLGLASCDRAMLAAALTHLLGASVDAPAAAAPQGSVQCKLSFEGQGLHVDVVDDSAGVPQEEVDRGFQDWDLGRVVPASPQRGMTLWRLLVARALVQHMGGSVHATGTPGRGNRWTLDLPLAATTAR